MHAKPSLFNGYHYSMDVYWDNYNNGGFTQLSLDLSNHCNYKCDWCFNKHLINKQTKLLSLEDKKRILQEAVELGVRTLVFPGAGEPTLDPDFYPLVEIAYKLGLITVVYTNLTGNIDAEKINFLLNKNVSIGIKLDSLDPNYFIKRYHVDRLVFDKFFENFRMILKSYKGTDIETVDYRVHRIIANMVLTNENKHELKKISNLCKSENLPLFVRPVKPVDWAVKMSNEWKKIGNISGKLVPSHNLVKLAKDYNTLFSPSSTLENHCAIYAFGLTIKENGDYQLCPDHHKSRGIFGNAKNKSLNMAIQELNKQRNIESGFCVMLPKIRH